MKKHSVVIQGIEGSFHHIAADNYFKEEVNIIPTNTFNELIKITIASNGKYSGIIAIENSTAGSLLQNYGLLQNSNLNIEGEIYINIKQHLMAMPGVAFSDIQEIHSHSMAIQQCLKFLNKINPKVKIIETPDTALSAKNIAQNKLKNTACIASKMAANIFGLEIIKPRIETIKNNQTRFFILSANVKKSDDFDKASIYFKTSHEVGSLFKVLQEISLQQINLSKLQSFPILEESWQYFFHADIEFSNKNQYYKAIEKIKPITNNLTILGEYKRGKRIL